MFLVIDTGLDMVVLEGIPYLMTVSRNNALQRAYRTARVAPGTVLRMRRPVDFTPVVKVSVVLASVETNPSTSIEDLLDEHPHVMSAHSGSHVQSIMQRMVNSKSFVIVLENELVHYSTLQLRKGRVLLDEPKLALPALIVRRTSHLRLWCCKIPWA